jgi:murein L,D-transpeptidase YcbB/YkuD
MMMKMIFAVLITTVTCALTPACRRLDPGTSTRIGELLRGDAERVELANGESVDLSEATEHFYVQRQHRPAWTDRNGLNRRGRNVVSVLESAGEEGLNPERYRVSRIRALEQSLEEADDSVRAAALGDLDMMITRAIERYASDIVNGALNPRAAGLSWEMGRDSVPGEAFLDSIARGEDLAKRTVAMLPTSPQYTALKNALREYRARLANGALRAGDRDSIAWLSLNLDRWRMLPRDLGPLHILVNVAGFELDVLENHQSILAMRVVVGEEANQTPVFADSMQHIVVNPYWNVPASIMKEEIMPAVLNDPGYLERNNMEVVERGEEVRVVDAGSIDWSDVDSASFPWAIRQRPGPGNALGKVKFMLPNHHNIYLHDTPADQLFDRTERAFSHGCIRLEKPIELARLVLQKATSKSPAILEELMAAGDEKWIELDRRIPVYILYLTAWVETNGAVHFHTDPYERDARLSKQVQERLLTTESASPAIPN